MRFVVLFAGLCACVPGIPRRVPVSEGPSPGGTAVEVCRLTAEQGPRPRAAAVDELSTATWRFVIGSILVRHPSGLMVIDPAFGRDIARDLRRAPLWFRLAMGSPSSKRPLIDLLETAGVDPLEVKWVGVTHAHWDHVGALRDLPRSQVLLWREEQTFVQTLSGRVDRGAIPEHFEGIPRSRFAAFELDGPPAAGFDRSHDLFGDGSIVAVPLPGHTPGSTGFAVRDGNGRRWLFIGDAAWSLEGVRRPAHKGAVGRVADGDLRTTGDTLGLLHAISIARPDLTIVPAHDLDALELIPECARR